MQFVPDQGGVGEPSQGEGGAGVPGRLNLLLSSAGWQTDPWVECLPRLLAPLGVQSYRACSGRKATEVIRALPIHIAVVDLGLPLEEGPAEQAVEGGTRVLELLSRMPRPPATVVVKRGRTMRDDCRELNAALRAGAFAVVDRPRDTHDVNVLLEVMRRMLARFYQGRWPAMGG